jgi:hypothetical protein
VTFHRSSLHFGRALAVLCVLLAVALLSCGRPVLSASERPARIYVTDSRLDRLPLYAAAVKARQAVSPTIWLVTGDPFADKLLAALSDGAAQEAVLGRAGVDAMVLTPEWLSFGLPRLNEIVGKGRYYALSSSLVDASNQTIGQPFMVKRSGPAAIAITGIALDSTSVLIHLAGVRYVAPGMAAGKSFALMRQRGDLVGVMVEPHGSGTGWGADFTVNLDTSGATLSPPGVSRCRTVGRMTVTWPAC